MHVATCFFQILRHFLFSQCLSFHVHKQYVYGSVKKRAKNFAGISGRRRTKKGIETARLNEKILGRSKGVHYITDKEVQSKRFIQKRARAFGGDLTDTDCMKLANISRGTYYKYKKEPLKNQCKY